MNHQVIIKKSETTLNYWMMVERYPNLKEEVSDLKAHPHLLVWATNEQ